MVDHLTFFAPCALRQPKPEPLLFSSHLTLTDELISYFATFLISSHLTPTHHLITQVRDLIDNDPRIELHDVTEDVDKFYSACDVLLFPSLNEVTPMVISEAMSYGLPVVTTNIAGIPEMVNDGQEGFLFEPGDSTTCIAAMQKLADDPGLRLRMGDSGKSRFAASFDLNIMVRLLSRVCSSPTNSFVHNRLIVRDLIL